MIFFVNPALLSIQRVGERLLLLQGAFWHQGKEVVIFEMEWGSNHDTRASGKDDCFDLPDPQYPSIGNQDLEGRNNHSVTVGKSAIAIPVVFHESVRLNGRDGFEKKGFAENRQLYQTANLGYWPFRPF